MGVFKINGVEIPTPQTMKYNIYDIDSEEGAGRNQMGKMFRDRVAVKRKIECTWAPMYSSQINSLLNKMTDEFFSFTYPDAQTGGVRTMICYVGDRSAEAYMIVNGSKVLWQGLSANFIER